MVEYWRLITSSLPGIWKHRRWGLLTTLILASIGASISLLLPGEYEATARAHVDTQSILKPLMQGMTVQPNVEQQVQMMARTLISRPNLQRVMEAANLDEQGLAGGDEAALILLEKKIVLRPAGGTNFYSIAYRNSSQEAALKVVESLLSLFVESTKDNQARDTEQALAFVDEQINLSKQKLEATENALKEFKIVNINVMPNLAQDYVARSAEAQREQQQAKLELRQAMNARAAIQKRLTSVPETYSAGESPNPNIPRMATETETRLNAARTRLDDYLTRYTAAHPDVVNTRRVVSDLQSQVERERTGAGKEDGRRSPTASVLPNKLHQDLSISLSDAEARVASLSARVAEAEARMAQTRELSKTIPKVEAQFIQLNRDYASNKQNYEQLLSRRAAAQMAGSMEQKSGAREFRIVDPPRVSPRTIWPNRLLLLLMTCFGSIVAGVAVAFFLDRNSPAFFDRTSLQQALAVPCLGSVSFLHSKKSRASQRRSVMGYSAATVAYTLIFVAAFGYVVFGPNLLAGTSADPRLVPTNSEQRSK